MSASKQEGETRVPALTLFVTGDAPRSRRARANLEEALNAAGMEEIQPLEVDLLEYPEATVKHSVFATPALLRTDEDGEVCVIYGDLSDENKLSEFLAGI